MEKSVETRMPRMCLKLHKANNHRWWLNRETNNACVLSPVWLFATPQTESTRLLCPWHFPATMLEWVAIFSSRGSSHPGIQPAFLWLLHYRWIFFFSFNHWAPRKVQEKKLCHKCLHLKHKSWKQGQNHHSKTSGY